MRHRRVDRERHDLICARGHFSVKIALIIELYGNPLIWIDPFSNGYRLLLVAISSSTHIAFSLCGTVSARLFRFNLDYNLGANDCSPHGSTKGEQTTDRNKPSDR